MRILSWNVNGLRSVYKKGFLKWFKKEKPDILCLQEMKAWKSDLPQEVIEIQDCYSYFSFALRKGYSGVAVYSKERPLKVEGSCALLGNVTR